jgi:hypothetical protein
MVRFLAQHSDIWQVDRHEDIDPLQTAALKIDALEAPNFNHQIPNNIQFRISNDPNGFESEFGHLVIGNYLEFGIWRLGCHPVFGSGCAGLGGNAFAQRMTGRLEDVAGKPTLRPNSKLMRY